MSAIDPDLQALQGTWRRVAFEQDGVDEPPDDHGASNSLTTPGGIRARRARAKTMRTFVRVRQD